jgi:hypothetical protein
MPMSAVADVSMEPGAQECRAPLQGAPDFETIFRELSPMVYRTAVIDGEARIRGREAPPMHSARLGDMETRLGPGEEIATSPTIARRPLTEDITWSRNANAHLAILDSFNKGMAQTTGTLAPVATPGRAAAAAGQSRRATSSRRHRFGSAIPTTFRPRPSAPGAAE